MITTRIRPLVRADLSSVASGLMIGAGLDPDLDGWADRVIARWGSLGLGYVADRRIVGYLILAPPDLLPEHPVFSPGVGNHAIALITGQVARDHRGQGIGHRLIQSAAATGVRRSCRTVETFGRTTSEGPADQPMLLPADWLITVGFALDRPHPHTPRLRMDLRTTSRWQSGVNALRSSVTGLLTPATPPEPAHVLVHRTLTTR